MAIKVNNSSIQHNANQFARLLDDCDVSTRGGVAALLPNCSEFVYCLRGATWSGRTFTPVNWHLKPTDVAYIIENSEACVLVAHADFSEVAQSVAHLVPPEARFSVGGDIPGFRSFDERLGYSDDELSQPLAGSIMMYTSGTTGRPKGVKPATPKIEPPPCMASKAGLMMLSTYLKDNAEGPHLVAAPLYHAAPITYTEGAALLGSDVVIMEKWNAEKFLRLVEKEKICSTFLVPTHIVRLLQLPEETRAKYNLSSLKFICHGAAPISKDVKRRAIDWLGPVLFEFYGGTEGGGISISSTEWLDHPGSVGKPRPDQAVYIIGDDGSPCATGSPGTIYFQANENRFEYKDDPEKTASAYRDDKYTLGDMGYLDEEGYLYICDRKADTIISGGVNIFPAEIEAVLQEHPAVRDCCVVGVKDDEWGEKVFSAIQLLDNTVDAEAIRQDIEQHCRAQLAGFQVPRKFVFELTLPRTETGKIKRGEVRDQYRSLYNTYSG